MSGTPASRLEVCIVAHRAFGALTGTNGYVGGVEHQTALVARWLAGRGHTVSMVTWNYGQDDGAVVDGVRIWRACRESDGLPVVKFVYPRWSSLLGALGRADADVYYQNCSDCVTGQVALWCRARGRRFVYSTSSDSDCLPRVPLLTARRDRVLYRAGLRRADRVIVQTGRQQAMLRQHFGRDATVIPMPAPDHGDPDLSRSDGDRIVWIGRICEVKRPDRLVDLAQRFPATPFDLVGPEDGSSYASAIVERARVLPNVTVHGAVPRKDIPGVLRRAACLLCTSEIEGFPNTFLEAWSLGVPVVSTFDPGDVVQRGNLGWIAAPERLAETLARALDDPPARQQAGARARQHFVEHHTLDAVMPRFERLLLELAPR